MVKGIFTHMSKTQPSPKIKIQIWTAAAGRCQYRGCNKSLWKEELSIQRMNKAYIAHIIADSEDGPRGDKIKSPLLAKDFNNLMLLCDEHHRKIDIEDVDGHPEHVLIQMKREHEDRIELLTSLKPDQRSHIVAYGANIGQQSSPLSFSTLTEAILPDMFPMNTYPISLGFGLSGIQDRNQSFWLSEVENLEAQFATEVEQVKKMSPIKHFSLFALAPQPLLIKLGTLFSDLYDVQVFQLHREPKTWKWQPKEDFKGFKIIRPKSQGGILALNLSLSATITNNRIESCFDDEVSIWTITHDHPNNDFLKSLDILSSFRKTIREFLNLAKKVHGQNSTIHIFPAIPVSAAIEFGRVWMPKADLDMIIYDQQKAHDGFTKSLKIM